MAKNTANASDQDQRVTGPLVNPKPEETQEQRSEVGGQRSEEAGGQGSEEKPSAVLVKIRRTTVDDGESADEKAVIQERLANGPLIQVPYDREGWESQDHWPFPGNVSVFEVPAIVADAAVASGFFRAV